MDFGVLDMCVMGMGMGMDKEEERDLRCGRFRMDGLAG